MDLLNENRSLIHTGKLLRQPDSGFEWSGWTELFVLLFDNYRKLFRHISAGVLFTFSSCYDKAEGEGRPDEVSGVPQGKYLYTPPLIFNDAHPSDSLFPLTSSPLLTSPTHQLNATQVSYDRGYEVERSTMQAHPTRTPALRLPPTLEPSSHVPSTTMDGWVACGRSTRTRRRRVASGSRSSKRPSGCVRSCRSRTRCSRWRRSVLIRSLYRPSCQGRTLRVGPMRTPTPAKSHARCHSVCIRPSVAE